MNRAPNLSLDALEAAAVALLKAVQEARGDLSPHSISLPPALSDAPTTMTELMNEFPLAKARAGRSTNYLALLLKQLRSFAERVGEVEPGAVSAAAIEGWLYANEWSDKTRHGHLLSVRTLFRFANGRGYLQTNPALAVDLPTLTPAEMGVHSPDQVRAVLESCACPHTLRYLAIRYFAGLRGSEAAALSEDEVRDKFILVAPAKAKTRQRRLVTILPKLRAWLDVSQERGGKLPLR